MDVAHKWGHTKVAIANLQQPCLVLNDIVSYTNLYELSRFIYKADWIGCETQLEQISAQRKQF